VPPRSALLTRAEGGNRRGEGGHIRLNAWAWSWGDAAFPPATLAVTKSEWLRESINT